MIKVLAYHKIEDSKNFAKQIAFLKKRYTIISVSEINNWRNFSGINKKKPPLLITFDDGDISIYKNAFPILKKFDSPAIIFVITKLIGSKEPFWWDSINYYSTNENSNSLVWEVKKWPNAKRIDFLNDLKRNSDRQEFHYEQLTFEQLIEMNLEGIDIANHSHTHPLFDKCAPEELVKEMEYSTQILKNRNFSYDVFAYPNGNFSPETESIIKNAGVKIAFLFDHKLNRDLSNPLRISRLMVDDTTPLWKFKFILSGWHSRLLPVKGRFLKLFKKI